MPELTSDEAVCLSIMHGGEDHEPTNLLAIGRWQKPCEHLAELGYARKIDQFNHVITKAGIAAIEAYDSGQGGDYARIHNEIVETKQEIKDSLEQSAKALAEACNKQHRLAGTVPNQITYQYGQQIIARALELLK